MIYKSVNEFIECMKKVIEDIISSQSTKVCNKIIIVANTNITKIKFDDGDEMLLSPFFKTVEDQLGMEISITQMDSVPEEKGLIVIPYLTDPVMRVRFEGDDELEFYFDGKKSKLGGN